MWLLFSRREWTVLIPLWGEKAWRWERALNEGSALLASVPVGYHEKPEEARYHPCVRGRASLRAINSKPLTMPL